MPFNEPYLLSGSGSAFRPSRRAGPVVVAVIFFLALLGSGTVFLSKQLRQPAQNPTPLQAVRVSPDVSLATADDLALHLQNATRALQANLDKLAQAQKRLTVVGTALNRYDLLLEQRRLRSAEQLCRDAMLQATAAYEELRIANEQLKLKEHRQ